MCWFGCVCVFDVVLCGFLNLFFFFRLFVADLYAIFGTHSKMSGRFFSNKESLNTEKTENSKVCKGLVGHRMGRFILNTIMSVICGNVPVIKTKIGFLKSFLILHIIFQPKQQIVQISGIHWTAVAWTYRKIGLPIKLNAWHVKKKIE